MFLPWACSWLGRAMSVLCGLCRAALPSAYTAAYVPEALWCSQYTALQSGLQRHSSLGTCSLHPVQQLGRLGTWPPVTVFLSRTGRSHASPVFMPAARRQARCLHASRPCVTAWTARSLMTRASSTPTTASLQVQSTTSRLLSCHPHATSVATRHCACPVATALNGAGSTVLAPHAAGAKFN